MVLNMSKYNWRYVDGVALKEAIKERGISFAKVSRILGKCDGYITCLDRENPKMKMEDLLRVCTLIDAEPDKFIAGENITPQDPEPTDIQQEIITLLREIRDGMNRLTELLGD